MHEPYLVDVDIGRPGDLGGDRWSLHKFTSITAVFGKNGSGKSRLLRAIRDTDPKHCHYIIPERIGAFEYSPGNLAEEGDARSRRGASQTNFNNTYRTRVTTRVQAYFLARGTRDDPTQYTRPSELSRFLGMLLPDFEMTLTGKSNPPFRLIRKATEQPVGSVEQLSSGEAQVLTIALDLLTIAAMWELDEAPKRVMLIDEPDAHIHPDLQVRFADFVVSIASYYDLQVVVATHSPALLAALGQFGGQSASVIYLDRTRAEFKAAPFSSGVRELAACLGGHALMGPLFGVPLLLVEGDDDYRIWSQVPRHHVVSFSVIPCGGDEIFRYQRSLELIFSALREPTKPAGFALLDGDKALPAASPDQPQDHIKFLRLKCHEAENLYLSDEVLEDLGITWGEAVTRIVSEAHRFGQKEAGLATAAGWDRREVDIHELVDQLTQILDPKNVHWTIRVGRAIGSQRPVGQLADFLGDAIVEALWGPDAEVSAVQAAE
jgi:energy-coupling factor transporter ATP-binding protein EcfA2